LEVTLKMVNSTAMPIPPGWEQITNSSNFNPINASVTAWREAANGFGWDIAAIGILLIIPTAIYLKSQNLIAAAFGQLMVTFVLHYYQIVPSLMYKASYLMVVLMISFALAYKWKAQG